MNMAKNAREKKATQDSELELRARSTLICADVGRVGRQGSKPFTSGVLNP